MEKILLLSLMLMITVPDSTYTWNDYQYYKVYGENADIKKIENYFKYFNDSITFVNKKYRYLSDSITSANKKYININNIKMDKKIELFAESYLTQNPIPLTARYQHNEKIMLTLQLVDIGIVVGYQDFRMQENENNIAMKFSQLYFKKVMAGKITKNRIDDLIDKFLLPKKSKSTDIELIGNKLQETINYKTIELVPSIYELMTSMMMVAYQAEQIYFINSGLSESKKRKFIK